MKTGTASILLKVVLAFCAVALLLVVVGGVPGYMSHVTYVRPDLSGWALPMELYGGLISLPVFAAIAQLWMVFGTIAENNAFCAENAKRFMRIERLAIADLGLVAILWGFLLIVGVTPPFILLCLSGATFVGGVAIIVFRVLAALVQNATSLRQENELTI